MDWKTEQLRRGGWTRDDERKFALMLASDDRFNVEMEKGFGELDGLMKAMDGLDQKDDRAKCEAAFTVQARFDGIVRHSASQWKIIIDGLDGEAKRLGISFE